ncbi:MAG: 4-hydroxy-tetrahydrodipicolinate reductase [Nitrospinota bacterium]
MIKAIVNGCSGRMGRAIVNAIDNNENIELVGGVERAGSESIGMTLSEAAGAKANSRAVTDSLKNIIELADVVIDFTSVDSSLESFRITTESQKAIVIGTTGFTNEQKKRFNMMSKSSKSLISPNMSIGVNVLFMLAAKAAKILDDYDAEVVEMHHNKKVDAPSGTAYKLAELIAQSRDLDFDKVACFERNGLIGPRKKDEIGVMTLRGGSVVGDHTVILAGDGEQIELTHKASDRGNFAFGAVKAALWLVKQPNGLYSMKDMLNF